MNRSFLLLLLLVTAGAFALRLPQLDRRPMHNDEAVNALKFQALWERGAYRYDPDEFHGPVLYYATLPVAWLSGARDFAHLTETTLRLAPACFGAALVLLLRLLADGLGRSATLLAGVFTAISPAFVFYSRDFIHEVLLVWFTLLFLGASWRYGQSRRMVWAVLAGAALGLMHATKETFVLAVAAVVGAAALTGLWSVWFDRRASATTPVRPLAGLLRGLWNWKHALLAAAVAVVVSAVFFTSFFTNPSGPLDSLRSYLPWFHRAGGASPHIHPWYFYFERLLWFHRGRGPVWSEGAILLLALAGFVAGLRRAGLTDGCATCIRFLGFYTGLLAAAYSAVPYKTPWCLLGFWHGAILLAGVGAGVALRLRIWKWAQAAVGAAMVAAAAHLVWQAWQTSFVQPADRRNPYVYAQTSEDILELVEKVHAIAQVHPEGHDMLVKIMVPDGDYWPLPWYLRQFRRAGWWDTLPDDPQAPVMVVGARFENALAAKVETTHLMTGIYSLRPRTFLELYVEKNLWDRYVAEKNRGRNAPDQPQG